MKKGLSSTGVTKQLKQKLEDVEVGPRKHKICILAEGSYPYVFGGVSSWCNDIIESLPDVNFEILSIMPNEKETKEIRYTLPSNVLNVTTIHLEDFKKFNPKPKRHEPGLRKHELDTIRKFMRFEKDINWETVVDVICDRKRLGNPIEFLHSKTFWNILIEYYEENCPTEGFNEFFWTIRSMFVFFLTIMQSDLPEADLYHSVSTGYPGLLGLIANKRFNKPFLLTEHGIYAREREEDILKATWVQGIYKKMWINFFYFISCGAYNAAHKSISLFNYNREIQIELGANPETAVVIPNGVELSKYTTEKEPHETLNVGSILRIVPIKDVKTIIRAFKIVANANSKARLYLMGPYEENKEYYEECVELVKMLQMEDIILFTGKVKVSEYVKKMDLLLLNSISEAQPLVILEGHAAELPFVSSDVGACREMLEGQPGDDIGHSGIIVNPVSPRETAEAILTLLNDKKLRVQMGKNGRKRAERYYKQQDVYDKYLALYNELIALYQEKSKKKRFFSRKKG